MMWILDWARESCAKSIEDMENEFVRHAHFGAELNTRSGIQSRERRMVEINSRLTEYRNIFRWLEGARKQTIHKNAEEFAEDMVAMFRTRGKK